MFSRYASISIYCIADSGLQYPLSVERLEVAAERMVSGSCRPVLSLERMLSRHGGHENARSVARLHCQVTERFRPGFGGHVIRRSLATSSPLMQVKMSPQEVDKILRANQCTEILKDGPVKSFDTNTLGSNSPIEDSHAEAQLSNGGLLFGIFDGHGGAACGQVVAKRLFDYISAAFLPTKELSSHLEAVSVDRDGDKFNVTSSLMKRFNDDFELVGELQKVYRQSYIEYLKILPKENTAEFRDVGEVLTNSFLSLDNDMSKEATAKTGNNQVNMRTVTVAMSGCVAATAFIDGAHLHVASTGDCTAVVGSLSDTDTWIAHKLTKEHNSDNPQEVKRILAEHPEHEHHNIIKGDRLLSVLAPLRAFGDFKFKWSHATIEEILAKILGEHAYPPNYKSPPYLTARPDVTYYKLSPRDKFLVIGSDGLWDMMTPMQVVRLVGEHKHGKSVLSPFQIPNSSMKLDDIAGLLKKRQAAMTIKPHDTNAATHLIRNALGGTAYGVDHGRLSQMLSLPGDMVRMFRDDITIQVVFFNEDYLRTC